MVAFCQAENRPHTAPSDRLSRNMVMVVVCWRSLIRALALLQMFLLAQSASPAGSARLLHLWRWCAWMQIGGGQPRKCAELPVLPGKQVPPPERSEIHQPPLEELSYLSNVSGPQTPLSFFTFTFEQLWQLRYCSCDGISAGSSFFKCIICILDESIQLKLSYSRSSHPTNPIPYNSNNIHNNNNDNNNGNNSALFHIMYSLVFLSQTTQNNYNMMSVISTKRTDAFQKSLLLLPLQFQITLLVSCVSEPETPTSKTPSCPMGKAQSACSPPACFPPALPWLYFFTSSKLLTTFWNVSANSHFLYNHNLSCVWRAVPGWEG